MPFLAVLEGHQRALPARAAGAKVPARPAHVPAGGRGQPAGHPLPCPSFSRADCCGAGRTFRVFEFPACSSHKWCFVFFRIRTVLFCLVRRRQHCRLIILADISGEVSMGFVGRLDAVFCAASYDGPMSTYPGHNGTIWQLVEHKAAFCFIATMTQVF